MPASARKIRDKPQSRQKYATSSVINSLSARAGLCRRGQARCAQSDFLIARQTSNPSGAAPL
ncbi:hypothetical protein BTJ39_10595 [Izhakiella australiensis]|uniref:Uncharacterized protein n=1 Tax=Izhakiella australiensis TaxID=1926881 RepID=A0A1S8YLX3_9GAMM|nr:hypothetical protein BTJ39_10595 [Izhakiella australiensis]